MLKSGMQKTQSEPIKQRSGNASNMVVGGGDGETGLGKPSKDKISAVKVSEMDELAAVMEESNGETSSLT